jgi:hypothetical protein
MKCMPNEYTSWCRGEEDKKKHGGVYGRMLYSLFKYLLYYYQYTYYFINNKIRQESRKEESLIEVD